MDHIKHQLLLSLSIFSFLFSYFSPLPFLLHFFNFYFSAFPFQLFSYTTDKYFIFLLCSGILVFLARNSGLIGSFPIATDLHDEIFFNKSQSLFELSDTNASVFDNEATVIDKQLVVESTWYLENVVGEEEKQEGRDNRFFITGGGEIGFLVPEDDENEEEGNGVLSAEELNKKFDDFIKRMKEGIRIEALQHIL